MDGDADGVRLQHRMRGEDRHAEQEHDHARSAADEYSTGHACGAECEQHDEQPTGRQPRRAGGRVIFAEEGDLQVG